MTTLGGNLVSRVRHMAKPSNKSQAMQPFFEAVSNAVMAINERCNSFGDNPIGHVKIDVDGIDGGSVEISIRDNGIGLDQAHFKAFCEVDSDFNQELGGKGVGRLYWLDSFKDIEINSQFRSGRGYSQRNFNFRLRPTEQVDHLPPKHQVFGHTETGTIVRLIDLKKGPYAEEFPKEPKEVLNYFISEFIADLLSGNIPKITLCISSISGAVTTTNFPDYVTSCVVKGPINTTDYANGNTIALEISGYLCKKEISQGFEGCHQIHLLGNMRTVQSKSIDSFIDINSLGAIYGDNIAVHIVVRSTFLDNRVSENRANFTVPASIIDDIVKTSVEQSLKLFAPTGEKPLFAGRTTNS